MIAIPRLAAVRLSYVAVVRAIITMAHTLGKEVVAEGVETPAQLAFLRALGCDAAQGFLLGRPTEATNIAPRLAA